MSTRVLVPLTFIMVGVMLLIAWVEITLSPLIRFGLDVGGPALGLLGIVVSLGTGMWLFKLYLDCAVNKLIELGWRKGKETNDERP